MAQPSGFTGQRLRVCCVVLSWMMVVRGDDRLVQIVLKQPVNVVSDEFVSFTMDPADVMNVTDGMVDKLSNVMSSFTPAYLKISGPNTKSLVWESTTGDLPKSTIIVNAVSLNSLAKWTNTVGLKTVFTLPYESTTWTPRDVMKILGTAKQSGITKCIWQLGADFNASDPISYVDDLGTLRHISDAFGVNGWGVIGADISPDNDQEESKFYMEMAQNIADTTGWTKHSEDSMNPSVVKWQSENVLQHSNRPLWLNFDAQSAVACSEDCATQGLDWAYTLGTSAQQGFSMVFRRVFKQDILNPTLSAYVSVLHKKLMGNQVFETRMVSGNYKNDRKQLFTHCSRNISGAFTVMGVNFDTMKEKISTKLPIKSTGSLVLQYVLTTNQKGAVLINGESVRLGGQVKPIIKTKKPNRLTSFLLQEKSVTFWVFPNANVRECFDTTGLTLDSKHSGLLPKTSSEKLLQELIIESMQKSGDSPSKRPKRHLVVKKNFRQTLDDFVRPKRFLLPSDVKSQFRHAKRRSMFRPSIIRAKRQLNTNNKKMANIFEKFELRKKKQFELGKHKPFQLPSLFKKGPLSIPPVVSSIQDVYKVDSSEKIFKSSENFDLPNGDVFLEVGDDKSPDYEYVAFEEPSKQTYQKKTSKKTVNTYDDFGDFIDVDDDSAPAKYPNQLYEGYPHEDTVYRAPPATMHSDWPTKGGYSVPIVSGEDFGGNRYDVGKIVKAVEPSWEENQMNLRKSKVDLERMYIDQEMPRTANKVYTVINSEEAFFTK